MKCAGDCGTPAVFRLGLQLGDARYCCASCLLTMLIKMVEEYGRVDVTRVAS
jgi:hypothetical protein